MRVRVPADLNTDDVFLSLGLVKLSLVQLVTVAFGLLLWVGVAKYMMPSVPLLHLNGLGAYIASAWIPLTAIALVTVKVKGRPLDWWVGQKFSFYFGARTYILREQRYNRGLGQGADLYRDYDAEALLDDTRPVKTL